MLAFVLGTAGTAICAAPGLAASLVTANYQLDWTQDVEKMKTETTDTRKLKQTLELKFKGFLTPIVSNEISFKVEHEVDSSLPDKIRFLPTIDLGFRGRYWTATAGAKRTHENSDEPGTNPKITDNYFVEFLYLAPKRVPDLKAKYTLDEDFEEGTTDTRDQEITLSSVYKPTDWLDLKGEYTRSTTDDGLNPDSDTKEQTRKAGIEIRHLISEKIKIDAQYTFEETRGATLLDAGGVTDEKDDETHTAKSALSFRPFDGTSLDGSYDFDIKQDKVIGEHTLTTNEKFAVSQKIGKPYEAKAEISRNIVEDRHTADDNRKTEDIVKVEFKATPLKLFDLSLKYEVKDTDEEHFDDPTRSKTSGTDTRNATWTGELTPFWKASVSYERIDTFENEIKTVVDTKYGFKSTLDFKAIRLTLDPTYDITMKDDFLKPEETETRDLKVKLAWNAVSTRFIAAKVEHTYGRKTDSAAGNIERSDDSKGNVTLKDSIPGMTFAIDLTRTAKDTSGDDQAPDINSTFGFKIDYQYLWLALNTSYKYDKRSLADDSETFEAKAAWTARKWDVSLLYSFDKTFSVDLDEKYSVTLAFKYNLQ